MSTKKQSNYIPPELPAGRRGAGYLHALGPPGVHVVKCQHQPCGSSLTLGVLSLEGFLRVRH